MPDSSRAEVGPLGRVLLFSSFLLTGATALVFEVVWTRLLLLSLGATAVAVGAVLGAFMGGMAIGAHLAGRPRVARIDPVLAYAALEGWAGLYGLATPSLLRLTEGHSAVVQYALGLAILMPATIGMGASLPILARALGRGSSWLAVDVGRLYAANTAGAVIGPLAAVFWLFPLGGLLWTLHVAGGIDIVVCVVLIAGRRRAFPRWAPPPEAEPSPVPPGSFALGHDGPLLVALFVSGAAAMVYEVAWTRVLSLAFASSVYGVTIMLSAFLAGLAGGSAWASAVLRRAARPATTRAVSLLLGGAALGAYGSLALGHALPGLFLTLHEATGSETGLFVTQFLMAALLMLPSTLCLGALLPVAASAAKADRREAGERISRLYAANLVGSALGAVLASAVLLGQYGISLTVRLASGLALATALAIMLRMGHLSRRQAAAAAASLLLLLSLSPGGREMARGIGFYSEPGAYAEYDAAGLRRVVAAHDLLYYRDGPTATVAVHQVGAYRLLKINGKTDASNGPGDMQTQLLLAHLPLMVRDAERVAVVGWGSGVTAGAALSYPVEQVDAFEIEPAVVEASAHFEELSGEPMKDPRLHLVVGDARAELLRSEETYDVVISEPSNPWITGISNLFTREYFRLVESRLNPDGVVCQWFHLYGMSPEATRSLVATFSSVFPHRLLFTLSSGRDVLLLGSHEPLHFSMDAIQRVFDDPEQGRALGKIGLHYPYDLLIQLTLDTPGIGAFAGAAPLNTDDNMRLELSAPRTLYLDQIDAIHDALREHATVVADHVDDPRSRGAVLADQAASLFTAERHEEALAACEQALSLEPSFEAYKLRGQILEGLGRTEEARRAFEFVLDLGGSPSDRAVVEGLLRSLERRPE